MLKCVKIFLAETYKVLIDTNTDNNIISSIANQRNQLSIKFMLRNDNQCHLVSSVTVAMFVVF